VSIYQGDDPNALNNLLVGRFLAEGFSRVPAGNEILCRMDLDGILRVTATEKRTGLAKQITIEGATTAMSESDMARARLRMQELFGVEDEETDFDEDFDEEDDDEVIDIEASDLATDASAAEADRDRRVQSERAHGRSLCVDRAGPAGTAISVPSPSGRGLG